MRKPAVVLDTSSMPLLSKALSSSRRRQVKLSTFPLSLRPKPATQEELQVFLHLWKKYASKRKFKEMAAVADEEEDENEVIAQEGENEDVEQPPTKKTKTE